MIWDILLTKITDAGLAVENENLFLNTIPAEVNLAVMLKAPLTGVVIDPYLPGYYKPSIQAIVRHTDPVEGEAMASQLSRTLTIAGPEFYPANGSRGAVKLSLFYPRTLPIMYPRQDGNSFEWSINFNTAFAVSN
ncbi:MAG: hypothetical protein EOQ56_27680 [Mesorhizobium sp.]|nr:MAG: hypothetical protein EOQ56_27680 [Mesorhizobium sp.]